MSDVSELSMKIAVMMEIHAALSTTTLEKAKSIDLILAEESSPIAQPAGVSKAENFVGRVLDESQAQYRRWLAAQEFIVTPIDRADHIGDANEMVRASVGQQWRAIENGEARTHWVDVKLGDLAGWEALSKKNPDHFSVEKRDVFALTHGAQ